jgi:hypothetical protein
MYRSPMLPLAYVMWLALSNDGMCVLRQIESRPPISGPNGLIIPYLNTVPPAGEFSLIQLSGLLNLGLQST